MKFLLFSVLLAVALAQPLEVSEKDLGEWETFKVKYMKQYDTEEEEAKRLNIFVDRLKFIREHNAKYENGETTFTVGVNKFADLSTEEFVASRNGYKRATVRRGRTFNMTSTGVTAASVDWRKKGAVTAIKDQGDCGSCWAFSTTGSLEGQHYITSGSLVSLSEQNLVDCSTENDGCDGGGMDDAFEYIMNNGGIDTESSYPYTGEDGSCKYKKKSKGATCTGYVDIAEGSETDLQTAVTNIGPISVAIDADPEQFHYYSGGIFASSNCSTTELNHGVLVVGYGVQNRKKYWLVKNSWGTDWGLSGYFMLAKNKNNMCGIASGACYPTV